MNNSLDEREAAEKYLNDFLDIVEELPDDIAPHITMLHETTAKMESIARKLDQHWETIHMPDLDPSLGTHTLYRVQNALIQYQEHADKKNELWRKILDLIENSRRTLDLDLRNLNLEQENVVQSKNPEAKAKPESVNRRSRRHRNSDTILRDTTQGNSENDSSYAPSTSKEQKKKVGKANAKSKVASVKPEIDSDEPVYCLCNQVSYGDMVGCDNDDCALEWFHFPCVNLTSKPKGKWYCPNCRGERSNQMKSRIS